MGPLTRREALGALGGAVTVTWLAGAPSAAQASPRARAGGPVALRCPGADAFRVDGDLPRPRRFAAPGGTVRFRAPGLHLPDGRRWATLRCTPLAGDRPVGAPVEVQVLTLTDLFGA